MERKQILSCIQPTGEMHIGNYFGAVKNWTLLQEQYDCIYGVVDYHAMTMPYKPSVLKANTLSMLTDLIACGVDPSNLFIQSMIPEHAELAWILGCVTSYADLKKQVQFKDKSSQDEEKNPSQFISSGLFTYPVLQAADILMYHADLVPVGRDQQQHLELARSIAVRFNSYFETDYFNEPQCHFTSIPKLMSLADPNKKMSKSLGPKHYIGLFEEETSVRQKIQSAVTQGTNDGNEMSPGIQNLFEILIACDQHQKYEAFNKQFEGGDLRFKELKDEVFSSIIGLTSKFRKAKISLDANQDLVQKRIINSTQSIREKARKTLREVKVIAGLSPGW